MKTTYLILLLFIMPTALAHDEPHPPIEVGESIVNADLSCDGLDDEQVLAIGTYLYGDHKWSWWLRLKARIGYCWGK